jgi:glycerol-1-phosphate dehydrogenase [NAD(P)+]
MNKIEYALSHATDTKALMLGKGVIIKAGELFKEQFPGRRAVIVANPRTFKAAGAQVKMLLDNSGISQDEPFII